MVAAKSYQDRNIVKGDEFIITFANDKGFTIKTINDEELDFKIDDLHKYFYVNYAMTIHTSQGSTFKEDVYVWDWLKIIKTKDASKLGYTALSRATDVNKLFIVNDKDSIDNKLKNDFVSIFGNDIPKEKLGLCF